MNKEEVILLAKKAKSDERETQVKSRGFPIGTISIFFGVIVVLLLRMGNGDSFIQDLMFLVILQVCTLSLYQYIKLRNRIDLITFIVMLVPCVYSFRNILVYYGYF